MSIRITGANELFGKLNAIAVGLRGDVVRSGLNSAGRIITKRAKELVRKPSDAGYNKRSKDRQGGKNLQETIGHVVRGYNSAKFSGMVLVVGPQYPAGSHGHLVEYGHRIAKRGTGTLTRIAKPGKRKYSTPKSKVGKTGMGVSTGSTRAFPFMEPAARDSVGKITEAIAASVQKAIAKAVP